ncbi:hypothetical protein [Enterococcus mundtii]|uniref:hypothetical protein n=1 Tax=Enterococcus mundtii TaxID=53346 RepID=UPI0032DEFE4C
MDKKKQIRLASSILAIGLLTNTSLQTPIAHAQDNLVASANISMLSNKILWVRKSILSLVILNHQ